MACERVLPALLLLGLAACGQHDGLSRTDTVTAGAGDASARNIGVHAVDPLAGASAAAPAPGDGVRAVAAFLAYRRGETREPEGRSDDGAAED